MKTWVKVRAVTYFLLGGLCFISPFIVKWIPLFNNNVAWKIILALIFGGAAFIIDGLDKALDDKLID